MMDRARLSAIATLALVLAGCAPRHIMLTPLTPTEKTMDCPQIQLALDRADTLRWVIRDSGGHLETSSQRSARYAGNVISVPASVLLLFIGIGFPIVPIPAPFHDELDAADGRIRELLQLKRAQGCPPRTTALPGMNDLDLLLKLEPVQADIDARRGDEDALFKERTRLLDGLRIVPAPAAVRGATIGPAPAKDKKPAATE